MALLLGCLSLLTPRLVLIFVVLLSDYVETAYATLIWPLLGFFFLPITTLAYAWAWHQGEGHVSGFGLFVVVLAALFDLGALGGGSRLRHHRREA